MTPRETVRIPAALAGERVDKVVALLTGGTRSHVAELVRGGAICLNGVPVRQASQRVRFDDELQLASDVASSRPGGPVLEQDADGGAFSVAYEDADVLVVDKPPGVVVHPDAAHRSGTLVHGLLARYPELARLPERGFGSPDRPGIVHRLDKDTSGLLLVARSEAAFVSLSAQLADRSLSRTYRALTTGLFEAERGTIDAPIGRSGRDPTKMAVTAGGREARTGYRVLGRFRAPMEATELELQLETGRTHQIRVHLAAIGHPIVGDTRYGGERRRSGAARPFLHAERVRFAHPATGREITVSSALAPDLAAVLESFS